MLQDMITAAKEGKVTDFEAAFQQVMSTKLADRVEAIKADIGASVPIEGEVNGDQS